jgi:hypothetical protein
MVFKRHNLNPPVTPLSTLFQLLVYRGGKFYWWQKTGVPGKNHRPLHQGSAMSSHTYNETSYAFPYKNNIVMQTYNSYVIYTFLTVSTFDQDYIDY